jgi:hypothetical protein
MGSFSFHARELAGSRLRLRDEREDGTKKGEPHTDGRPPETNEATIGGNPGRFFRWASSSSFETAPECSQSRRSNLVARSLIC